MGQPNSSAALYSKLLALIAVEQITWGKVVFTAANFSGEVKSDGLAPTSGRKNAKLLASCLLKI